MKIFKQFILISLIFSNGIAFSQSREVKSTNFYYKGLEMYQNGKFKEADSLFNLSIKELPDKTTYFRLAQTKMMLNDTCGYCKNMKMAQNSGDKEAGTLYDKKCIVKRKINFSNKLHPDSLFYAYFTKSVCTEKIISRQYCIKNLKNDSIFRYELEENDTSFLNSNSFPGKFPDFNRFKREKPIFVDTSAVYTVVEVMPIYPGGDEARIMFLTSNLKYPQKAKETGIMGTIYVTFIVEKDGSVSNVKVLRGIGSGCDEETVRVVKLMPKWIPGTQNGKPVRVQFNMPIKFSL